MGIPIPDRIAESLVAEALKIYDSDPYVQRSSIRKLNSISEDILSRKTIPDSIMITDRKMITEGDRIPFVFNHTHYYLIIEEWNKQAEDLLLLFNRVLKKSGDSILLNDEDARFNGQHQTHLQKLLALDALRESPMRFMNIQEDLEFIRQGKPGDLFSIAGDLNTLTKAELGLCRISSENFYMKVPSVFASLPTSEAQNLYQVLNNIKSTNPTNPEIFSRSGDDLLYLGLKIGTINGKEINLLKSADLIFPDGDENNIDNSILQRDINAYNLLRANEFIDKFPPKYSFASQHTPELVSGILKDDRGRYYVCMYVERPHGLTFQFGYFSQSQGDWRAPPALTKSYFFKTGWQEGDYVQNTRIQNPLQENLQEILEESISSNDIQNVDIEVFGQSWEDTGLKIALRDHDLKVNFKNLSTLNSRLKDLSDCLDVCKPGSGWKMENVKYYDYISNLPKREGYSNTDWDDYVLHLNNLLLESQILPDFTAEPKRKYDSRHQFLGNIEHEVFEQWIDDTVFRWDMASIQEDGKTKCFIASITARDSNERTVGLQVDVYNFGMLPCKPLEYTKQTQSLPDHYRENMKQYQGNRYVSVLDPISNIEPIRQYRELKFQKEIESLSTLDESPELKPVDLINLVLKRFDSENFLDKDDVKSLKSLFEGNAFADKVPDSIKITDRLAITEGDRLSFTYNGTTHYLIIENWDDAVEDFLKIFKAALIKSENSILYLDEGAKITRDHLERLRKM